MLRVRQGDRGQRVVLLQVMLNRKGASLNIDGVFGARTHQAVIDFQRRSQLGRDGNAGEATWPELLRDSRIVVIDGIDGGDPRVARGEPIFESGGAYPIVTGGMCNGVEVVVHQVMGRARSPGSIGLLRIWGHGNLGRWMTFSVGDAVHLAEENPEAYQQVAEEYLSYLSPEYFDALVPILRPLSRYFAPFGGFEHHGCSLGKVPATRELMQRLADLLGVPVTVGVGLQKMPWIAATAFRFSGATLTAYPGGGNLASWARTIAASETMSRDEGSSPAVQSELEQWSVAEDGYRLERRE